MPSFGWRARRAAAAGVDGSREHPMQSPQQETREPRATSAYGLLDDGGRPVSYCRGAAPMAAICAGSRDDIRCRRAIGSPASAGRVRRAVEVPRQRVAADRVGRRVAAELVQELQRRVGRRHQRVTLERRGRAREIELAVEILARDVGLRRRAAGPRAVRRARDGPRRRSRDRPAETARRARTPVAPVPGNASSTASDAAASCSSD